MADVGLSAASIVTGCLVAPVSRLCGYVISYDGHVLDLEGKVKELDSKRQSVLDSINEAQNNMKPIKDHVNEWVEEGEKEAEEARRVLNDGRAEKTCFYGCLPNPKVRYRLGREARRKANHIQKLIDRKPSGKVYNDIPPAQVGGASGMIPSADDQGDTDFESRASILEDIMKALDDEKHKVIGVYGPGGVGKTTLLKKVEKTLKKKGRPFEMIVKVEVSRTPDLINIQGQIADALNLSLKDKETQQGRRDLLLQKLQSNPNEKVLIILDDLWEELNLEAVGIPSGDTSGKCKLLLTSRFLDVLGKMLADQKFVLEGLNNDEAFRLFEKMIGDRLKDDDNLKAKAHRVVKKLAGLPLLIISIASTLKDSEVYVWDSMLIKIDEPKVETIVKLSYDRLKSEEAKSLFLLCGLIGGTIEVETLFVLGMGLGLFERFDEKIQGARDRLNTLLDSLCSICLLQDGGNDKKNVIIHDLYSEVVVSTLFRGQNSLMMNNNCRPKTEKLKKCWAICLVDVGSNRVSLTQCAYPKLKILMLSSLKNWGWRPTPRPGEGDCYRLDFTYMKELRVLYLCSMDITTSLSSIEILGNLGSLYLDQCNVGDVVILGKLKTLQILSFAGSTISRLPKEIGDLTNLRLLNLSNCRDLRIIEPSALKGLINLEELHVRDSFVRWMGVDEIQSKSCNARLAELKSLTKLTSLKILIRGPTVLMEDDDLLCGNLINFWIQIGDPSTWREFEELRTMILNLEGCDHILSKEWIKKTLHNTQRLHLYRMRKSKKSAHELCIGGFPTLKHLELENSPSIKYIASSSDGAFPNLESLSLTRLINLEKICHDCVDSVCFSKLKIVKVSNCDQLKYLWCLSQMQRLGQLEEISVDGCHSMQAISTDDAGKDFGSIDNMVELPNVRLLRLVDLPNMTSFCTAAGITSEGAPLQVSFPCLEKLTIGGPLDLEKILYSQPPLEYINLKSISIGDSKSTSSILKSDWIPMLPNLESLDIYSCDSTKAIFELRDLKVAGHVEILSRLENLSFANLQNLQHIWKQDVQLQGIVAFRNLKTLGVQDTGLAFLFPVSVAKCLREIRDIFVLACPNMKSMIVDEEGRDEGTDDIIEFPLLKRLNIAKCAMEKFFSCPSGKKDLTSTTSYSQDAYSDSFFDRKVSLPDLEELWLNSVGSFKRIWHNELSRSSLCKLASITLESCSDLLHIFPATIIERLHNLKSVRVKDCPSLKSLFDCGSLDSNMEQTRVLLPELVSIEVKSCPSLESLFNCGSLDSNSEHKIVPLPKLEVVSVSEAGRLRHLVMSDSQTVLSFPSLKTIRVDNCSDLRYLFPNHTARTLLKLKALELTECKQMKEVITQKEVGRSGAEVMSFPCLSELTLKELENLISFSSGCCSYDFASLEDLRIVGCRNFGAFIKNPTSVKRQLGETVKENEESPQPLFNEMATFPNVRRLEIEGVPCEELWNDQILTDSFCKLESFKLKDCDNLLRIASSHMWKRLHHCLENLEVSSCNSIKIIFESDGMDTGSGKLRTLNLFYLDNLMHIWQCNGLSIGGEIESIHVVHCRNMKAEIVDEGGRDGGTDDIIEFPLLQRLYINGCPTKKFFSCPHGKKESVIITSNSQDACSDSFFDRKVSFPNIRELKIEGLQCKELWNNQIPNDSFCKLESLELNHCDNLQRIAPSHMWKRLQCCLENLEVISCRSIEIIYESDGMDTEVGKLTTLVLRDLEKLRHIWQCNDLPNVPFPNLRDVEVVRCSHLEMLFPTFTAKFLGQIEELMVESCEDMKQIAGHEKPEEVVGTTITFSNLIALRLFELPKFRSFLPEGYSLKFPCTEDFPSLRDVSIVSCGVEPDQVLGDWERHQRLRQLREDYGYEVFLSIFRCFVLALCPF
ncbi:hypothetical protein BT93_G0139 [Corymbia citriodora subsp. variegata]|nr:hypothetical protein BT93_G0139 [Corymbia citriodora subsp. variegata]